MAFNLLIYVCLQLILILHIMLLRVTTAEDAVIGDVHLIPTHTAHYEVQVYFGDGLQAPSWVGICKDRAYNVDNVICRQLGYNGGKNLTFSVEPSKPIKLLNVDCRDMPDANHILRCKYDVSQTSNANCSGGQALAIDCDFTPLSSYDGQVVLCPPLLDGHFTNLSLRSASFGVIGLRLNNKIQALSQPNGTLPLGGSEADAICRQLGYTGVIPGSVATKHAYENMNVTPPYNFSHCFSAQNDLPFPYIHNESWLSTDQILKCTNLQNSQKCFGCCYDYQQNTCEDPACIANRNDVVIRCGFDPSKIGKQVGTAGSSVTCAFNKNQKIEQCTTDCDKQVQHIKTTYGAVIGVLVTITGAFTLCICRPCIYRAWRRVRAYYQDYDELAGDNANNPDQRRN